MSGDCGVAIRIRGEASAAPAASVPDTKPRRESGNRATGGVFSGLPQGLG